MRDLSGAGRILVGLKLLMKRTGSSLRCRKIVIVVFAFLVFAFYRFNSCNYEGNSRCNRNHSSFSWPRFLLPHALNDEVWRVSRCFISRTSNSLINLNDRVNEWTESDENICKEIGEKFNAIYSIDVRQGQVRIPAAFAPQVARWLGNGPDSLMQVKSQVVIHVFNRYTYQHTIYTPLRARRPLGVPSKDPKLVLNNLIDDSKKNCDFCNYHRKTAEDTFGRLESRYAVTAANIFKMEHWHSLIILRDHNPFNLTINVILDVFNLTTRWLHTAHSIDPTYKFPSLVWDMLPRAGASQIHPHLQVFLAPKRYYGRIETLRHAAHLYSEDLPNSNLFSDVVAIHMAAGLSVRLGDAVAMVDMAGGKNYEIVIMSEGCSENVYKLLYLVIKLYTEKYRLYSFSSVMVFPTMGFDGADEGRMPVILRISPRGNADEKISDISSFELYLVNNVSVDPYEVIVQLTVAVKEFVLSMATG